MTPNPAGSVDAPIATNGSEAVKKLTKTQKIFLDNQQLAKRISGFFNSFTASQ